MKFECGCEPPVELTMSGLMAMEGAPLEKTCWPPPKVFPDGDEDPPLAEPTGV